MPYVDLFSKDDYASIYYQTGSLYGNVGGFDREMPTIMILAPLLLDSSWLDNQFGDPRLYQNYNVISFDMRCCGKSQCRSSPLHDSWVDAADVAFCVQKLHLPACHILAFEGISVNCALRLCVLFPEMCLSMTLCNVPAPTELKWVYTALEELMHISCFAEDVDTFEHAAMESMKVLVGPEIDIDLQDEIMAYWQEVIPPTRRHRIVESFGVLMNRTPLKPEVYASISQPVLLLHAERHEMYPKEHADLLAKQLCNAEGGARVYIVKSAIGSLSIVPGIASIANQIFHKFLSNLPHVRSELKNPTISIEDRMTTALIKLGKLSGDATHASRDPSSSLSFSCLPPDVIKRQVDMLVRFQTGRLCALSPLGPDGNPGLKYSEKRKCHWSHADKNGMSIVGPAAVPSDRRTERMEKQKPDKRGVNPSPPTASNPKKPAQNEKNLPRRLRI